MNIEELKKEYISEGHGIAAEYLIKEYEEKIKEEKIILRKRKIMEEILLELLNAHPYNKEGEWIVSGAVRKYKEKISESGDYELSKEDREDLEFASGFLTACEIPNKISFKTKDMAALYFDATIQERDQLEQYMIENKQEKTLAKIKRY